MVAISKYLTLMVQGKDTSCIAIKTKDRIAIAAFLIGIIFAIAVAITTAMASIQSAAQTKNDEKQIIKAGSEDNNTKTQQEKGAKDVRG